MKVSHILLVFSAILCIAPPVVAQPQSITDETVIIQIDDHLITFGDYRKEGRRLLHKNPSMEQEAGDITAISNLVEQALALQVVAKYEVPVAQYHSITNAFVLKEIERAGSINDFLLEKEKELGALDIEEFRDYIYRNFVYAHVIGVVVGNEKTAGKGLRAILDPSPAEIRRTYKEAMSPAVLEWSYLRFYPNSTSAQTPTQRVTEALTDLDKGSRSEQELQELINLADHALPKVGQPKNKAAWIIDFVSSESAGEYLIGPDPTISLHGGVAPQGSVAMVIITAKAPPTRMFKQSFGEAQPLIVKLLTDIKKKNAINAFFVETGAVVDVWVTDTIPGLKDLVSGLIGRKIPANNHEGL